MAFFDAIRVAEIPPMAWLYMMHLDRPPLLIHGTSVELLPDGFFEGCFAGPWIDADFENCAEVFGSGLKIREGVHHFVAPCHMLESLYGYSCTGRMALSNSLCFLLEYFGLELPLDLDYGARFATAIRGIGLYDKHLADVNGGEIWRILHDNVAVYPNLTTRTTEKMLPPAFTDFNSYAEYVSETLRQSFANAADPRRTAEFQPVATCSSGYDSSAGAAIASQLGCRAVLTTRTGRSGTNDSGRPVGHALGMDVIEVERETAVQAFSDAAEFLATGMGGQDYNFRNFAPYLKDRILLTGIFGDMVWDYRCHPTGRIARKELTGNSLQEFRLLHNFIHLPVPAIGIRRDSEIAAISQRAEMKPFVLGNDYDRPIARRFLEERGVPREAFGMHKNAASFLLFHKPEKLPEPSRESPAVAQLGWGKRLSIWLLGLSWQCRFFLYRLARKASRYFSPFSLLANLVVREFSIFEHHHPQAAVDFLNGVAVTRQRYSAAPKAIHSQAVFSAVPKAIGNVQPQQP